MRRTGTTAYAILGLLALRPVWSIYDLTQQLRRNMRFFWPRAESRIYAEAKALVGRGWAKAELERYGKRSRTMYRITPAGRRELRRWLATPPGGSALDCEPLLRVFLGTLGDDQQLHAGVEQLRADADAILDVGRRVSSEYLSGTAPFQDQVVVRALVFDFLSHYALMLRDFADRTDRTLADWSRQDDTQRTVAALNSIEWVRSEYPDRQ